MGAAVSSSHLVSAAPSSSGGGLLTRCPCSNVRSLPRAAALHELPQHGSPPQGHKPCQQTCSSVGSSIHGSTGPGRSLLWRGVPSTGYRWRSTPLWTSMDCRGTSCLTMVFSTSCKERLSALTFQEPPPPPSSLTLVSAELFLSHRLTPLCQLLFFLLPFLNVLSQRHYHRP